MGAGRSEGGRWRCCQHRHRLSNRTLLRCSLCLWFKLLSFPLLLDQFRHFVVSGSQLFLLALPDGFIGGGHARLSVDSFYVHSRASTFCTPARRFDFETDLDLLYSDMKAPPCLDLLYDLPMWLGARAHSATACLSFRWQFPGLAESGGDFPGPSSSCVAPCLRVASWLVLPSTRDSLHWRESQFGRGPTGQDL